jgi:hypothetical protein
MKMLMIIYSGAEPERISALLDEHQAGGYTEFHSARGAGTSGKRDATRAWHGAATLFMTIVPIARVEELLVAVRQESRRLSDGERLHAAVLPTDAVV